MLGVERALLECKPTAKVGDAKTTGVCGDDSDACGDGEVEVVAACGV